MQETWLIHMLVRLQDTQEATASFARPADLRQFSLSYRHNLRLLARLQALKGQS